jgi:N-methylhydantoinase B/oxoprolinase/acetone carboxylase alpha subunit
MSFDPVLLAVMANRLDGIVREMTNTLLRAGRSAILNTARDFSCSIVTADDRLLSAAEGLPIHIVGSQYLTEAMHELHPEIRRGDAFLHNDPYHGNTHHADHTILVPVFHEGEHVFTAVAKAHQADCGNGLPTTYAAYAKDIYEEGALNFPCVRVQEGYEHVEDVIRMCRRRIRVPDQWYGDYLATLGAARIGERRLEELTAKYGAGVVREFCDAWFDYSERLMVRELRELPAARLVGTGRHDPVPGLLDDGIPLKVQVDIDPEAAMIDIDLRDNIDCVPAGFNESRTCAISSVIIGVFNQLPRAVPHNEGSFRRIRVHLRENCVAGIPLHPTCCSVATTNVADRLINITQSAFAELGPGYGLAEGAVGSGPGFGVISGVDSRRGDADYINQVYFASSGGPAGPVEDGWLFYGIPVCGGLMYRDSVEVDEQKYPILIDEVRLKPDSEGAGRFRGAPGSRVTFGPTDRPMTVAYVIDGHYDPPRGVLGGGDAEPHDVVKLLAGGAEEAVPKVGAIDLRPGDTVMSVTNGGGGYGPPGERDPERVRRDVEAGLVTPGRAERVYRVAVTARDDGTYEVDEPATARLRGAAA